MAVTANLGFPRIGRTRQLKWSLERAWREDSFDELRATSVLLRRENWASQLDRNLERIPVGDFSLYDHVLDAALAVGIVPDRFGGEPFDFASGDDADLRRYFAMARGGSLDGADVAPLEMTKWFDTNYHFLVPELAPDQSFQAQPGRLVREFHEAVELGVPARVVLIGPVTLLTLSKRTDGGDPLELLEPMLVAYGDLLSALLAAGVKYLQLDEPWLVGDLGPNVIDAYRRSYDLVREATPTAEVTLATYFGSLGKNAPLAVELPVDVLHLDLVRGRDSLEQVLQSRPESLSLSLGLVDGRNIWTSDLVECSGRAIAVTDRIGADRVQIAPSCSLLHLPFSTIGETQLGPEIHSWLAFATERLDEIETLGGVLNGDAEAVAAQLDENRSATISRRSSASLSRPEVAERIDSIVPQMVRRSSRYQQRRVKQMAALGLHPFPTTTIGSFPQTPEIREVRRLFKRGEIDASAYESVLKAETEACVREQEALGLDVLVHGEFERTDMVEYFGEHFDGYFTTVDGWVQSYGSRCVKPPVLYGDISRRGPITVGWTTFAAGLTDRPMKAMLTGPVTILEWSFVRDDQPRSVTCKQIALALRDEVDDLVNADIHLIQVDEPALREGLPLRSEDRTAYLKWATEAFRLATSSAPDDVQIHTHMCYAEFADIIDAIVDMDADVISMEASRSQMELLDDFVKTGYPNEIGPGIWDIHSPRVPGVDELDDLIRRAVDAFGPDRLWINPDCGLKTRGWVETRESLRNLVAAAQHARDEFAI